MSSSGSSPGGAGSLVHLIQQQLKLTHLDFSTACRHRPPKPNTAPARVNQKAPLNSLYHINDV